MALADNHREVQIDIPAGPLSDSLLLLGSQARLSIVFGKEAVSPFHNPAVQGNLRPEVALAALLDDSCLSYEFIRTSLVAIKPGCRAPAEPEKATVPSVAEAEPPPIGRMEEIVVRERSVTGSRLARAGVRMPIPVDVITRPEIELSGHQSLGQILRYLPAVSGNSTSTLVTNGGNGTASVTLRGLPASNTLVLLNGRRMNPDALYGSAVDLNTLPLALIDRIEVLKDGASAVYGSDAVAGVVNVLTRADLDGWHADAYIGQSGEGDLETHNLSLSYAFNSDTVRVSAGASYFDQNALFSRDRALSSSSDDRSRGGIDKRSSATAPSLIVLRTGPVTVEDGGFRPVTTEDRYEYRNDTTLIVPSRRYSVFIDAEWQRDAVTWFAELLATRTSSLNTFAPTPLFTGFESLALPISANQAYNPFGVELFDVRRRVVERGTRRGRNESDTRRGVLGARGIFREVGWEVTLQQSRTNAKEKLYGGLDAFRVQQALGDNCAGDCVPLNLFGGVGSIDEEMLGYISVDPGGHGTSRMRTAHLTLDFQPYTLPAGDIEVVTGLEYREEWLHTQPDALLSQGGVLGSGTRAPTDGRRTIWEAFAEVRLPILRDIPGVHRLDAYLAGRLSHYNDLGRETNPRVLMHYQPTASWSLRASYTHGFRAPNLIELFGGNSQSFQQLNDPCALAANVGTLPGCLVQSDPSLTQFLTLKGGNANLLPERSRTFSAGIEWHTRFDRGNARISLDHYRIRQRNVVDTNAQFIINQNAEIGGFAERIQRDANGNLTRVLATFLNIGERDVQGLDLTAQMQIDTSGLGQFQLALNATHITKFEDRYAPGLPTIDQAGTFLDAASGGNGALPDWKASVGLNWQRTHWRAQYNVYVVSALDEIVPIIGKRREMELWATHNLQVSYLGPWTEWFRVSLGVNNLLDEPPPFSAAAFNDSYDSRTYDITGRYAYLRLERAI